MVSAWFGGLGPGLLATALAGWASTYYFYDMPPGTGVFGWDDVLRLMIFLMVALLISFLLDIRRRAERQLRNANEHLEYRVLDRTRELETSNRKVRESEEGLKALIEGVTDCAICLLDRAETLSSGTPRRSAFRGTTKRKLSRSTSGILFPAREHRKERTGEYLARTAATGRYEEEGWRIRKDGTPFWAAIIITPLFDDKGNLRGFAHVARDITEVKRLEREVIDISETEQRRIGHDLHDGLGQELTGLAFLSQNVGRKLADDARPEAGELTRISSLINLAIEKTRDLAKGLSPVEWGPDGLAAALQSLALRTAQLYGIPCEFRRGRFTAVESHVAAVHLYRIAQEALGNAARHSHANCIWISIEGAVGEVVLSVEDNGSGIANAQRNGKGMGLHLMPYRARTIGASFEIGPRPGGGTLVRCVYRHSVESPQNNRPPDTPQAIGS